MSLFLDIGQGAGLAGASGVRPFLPPLLAGGLARGDAGIDFQGTDFVFLESRGFLFAVFALTVVAYAFERSGFGRDEAADPTPGQPPRRNPVDAGFGLVGLALGGLLFAGTLADGGQAGWPGLFAGIVVAAIAYVAVGAFLGGARRRLDRSATRTLDAVAELAAVVLAGLSILAPPVGYLALAAFLFLLVRGRRSGERKYEGLRILR